MKTAVITSIAAVLLLAIFLSRVESPIVIQSEESRTNTGGPVFNRISLKSETDRDIWLMQQSHAGLNGDFHKWGRLAIVVDKTKTPAEAKYYQMQPGQLELDTRIDYQAKFLASCFMCHANGPRVIRPDFSSHETKFTLAERLRLYYWNYKIRSYGRVDYSTDHDEADRAHLTSGPPFRLRGRLENEKLTLRACWQCHTESNWGQLTRQNSITIQFMVERGYMPPRGYPISAKDRQAIAEFAAGF